MEIAVLVLGIISLVAGCLGPLAWIGTICAIVGVVLGAICLKKNTEKKGMAKAGFIMSIIALAFTLIISISCAACAHKANKAFKKGAEKWANEYNEEDLNKALEDLSNLFSE